MVSAFRKSVTRILNIPSHFILKTNNEELLSYIQAGARVRAKTHAHANVQIAAQLHCFI